MEQHQHQTASTPQIRSRITVVCAECKRLKLKCDRRSPCNSCLKRDTVARCIYSPAAAEKVDLHSLNNRLMHVEAMLAQVTAGTFQSTYPLAQPQNISSGANPSCVALTTPAPNPTTGRSMVLPGGHHHHHPASVTSHTHDAPHCLALTLEELRCVWVDSSESGRSGRSASGRLISTIAPQLSPSELDQQRRIRLRYSSRYPHARHPNPQAYLPPLSIYYSNNSTYGNNAGYHFPQTSPSAIPIVSQAVLDLLPSTAVCSRILAQAQLILAQRPVPLPGGWRVFEAKAIQLLNQRSNGAPSNPISEGCPGGETEDDNRDTKPLQHLPFFAVLCSILALGAAVSPPEVVDPENINAGFLNALAQQALSVWETNSSGRKDEMENIWFLVSCLSSVGYLLISTPEYEDEMEHSGEGELLDRKPRAIFPLVGKMVNVARQIGLGKEGAGWQDENDSSSSIPEVKKQEQVMWDEIKRMVWWEIMFYDLFTSDALGHPSLISPLSYSAKIPEMLDSTFDTSAKYVLARFRLVQLAQRVKHRLSHPDCCCGYTFDQAIVLEDEIRKWSREFGSLDEEDKGEEKRHGWELSLTAQLLVLRAYVPFIVTASSAASAKKQASGTLASGKGSAKTVEKPQINGNATAMATQSCLGAAQTILRLGNKLHVSLSKGSMIGPVLMDFYPLERLVLDAIVITQSSTAVSVVSEADIRRGLEILLEREALLSKNRREVWELMKRRVPIAAKLQAPPHGNNKRKYSQVERTDIPQGGALRNGSDIPVKLAKLAAVPAFGVRYRDGKLPLNNVLPQEQVNRRWESDRDQNHGLVMNLQTGEVRNNGQDFGEVDNRQPQPQPQQTGPFVASPTSFSSEQHQSLTVQQRSTLDRPMLPMPHRTSVDHTQSRALYPYEDSSNSATTPALTDPYPGINHSTTSSNSSSPYQASTSPFNGNPFNSPSGSGPSQYPHDTQTNNFALSESHSMGSYTNNRQNVSFDNSRSMFAAEHSQTQSFDKPHPHAYEHPTMESNQTTTPVGPPSLGSHSHGASPPTFGTGHPGINTPITPQGYYHPAPDGLSNYDGNPMHSLGMRLADSVPGTPRYEKTQIVYDKPHQHQSMHSGQAADAHAHNQHVMMSNGFVGEQSSQGMDLGSGQQMQLHDSNRSWTSSHPPPPALVGAQAGQSYW